MNMRESSRIESVGARLEQGGLVSDEVANGKVSTGKSRAARPKSNSGLKSQRQKLKASLLKTYYGNPMKDMKLIAITGTTGKTTVAHFVHEMLRASSEQVAVLASDQPFKVGMLHKFLSNAWKAGANYVIVTVPAEGLRDNVFYGLPVHVAAMTNFVTAGLHDITPEEYLNEETALFKMKPDYVVLNADDYNYSVFADFKGTRDTLDFGQTARDVKILNSKLYNKGTEATLSVRSEIMTVASFVPGETAISYMACAVSIAAALGLKTEFILDGLANYQP